MTDQNNQTVENLPNVVFIGKQRKFNPDKDKYELVPRPVPAFVTDGMQKIDLPEDAKYGRGFFSEYADRLIQLPDFLPFNHKEQPETDLPNDIPGREILRGLGLQMADVKEMDLEKLTALPKIGEVTAEKILKYLEALNNGE